MTKEELKQYQSIVLEITSIKNEIKELRNQAETIRAVTISNMPKSSSQVDFTDIITKIDEMIRKLHIKMANCLIIQKRIEDVIEKIDNPQDKIIIRQRYINNMKWEDIADNIGLKDVRQVFRIHGRILQKIKDL